MFGAIDHPSLTAPMQVWRKYLASRLAMPRPLSLAGSTHVRPTGRNSSIRIRRLPRRSLWTKRAPRLSNSHASGKKNWASKSSPPIRISLTSAEIPPLRSGCFLRSKNYSESSCRSQPFTKHRRSRSLLSFFVRKPRTTDGLRWCRSK